MASRFSFRFFRGIAVVCLLVLGIVCPAAAQLPPCLTLTVTPPTVTAGSGDTTFIVMVSGGLDPSAQVSLFTTTPPPTIVPLSTMFIDPTHVSAVVPASFLATPGTFLLGIKSAACGTTAPLPVQILGAIAGRDYNFVASPSNPPPGLNQGVSGVTGAGPFGFLNTQSNVAMGLQANGLPTMNTLDVGSGDFNGDGIIDIAAISSDSATGVGLPTLMTLTILLGVGDGTFGAPQVYTLQQASQTPLNFVFGTSLSVVDLDLDGVPDVVITVRGQLLTGVMFSRVLIVYGKDLMNAAPGGTVAAIGFDANPPGLAGLTGTPVSVATGRLQSDMTPDIAVALAGTPGGVLKILHDPACGCFTGPGVKTQILRTSKTITDPVLTQVPAPRLIAIGRSNLPGTETLPLDADLDIFVDDGGIELINFFNPASLSAFELFANPTQGGGFVLIDGKFNVIGIDDTADIVTALARARGTGYDDNITTPFGALKCAFNQKRPDLDDATTMNFNGNGKTDLAMAGADDQGMGEVCIMTADGKGGYVQARKLVNLALPFGLNIAVNAAIIDKRSLTDDIVTSIIPPSGGPSGVLLFDAANDYNPEAVINEATITILILANRLIALQQVIAQVIVSRLAGGFATAGDGVRVVIDGNVAGEGTIDSNGTALVPLIFKQPGVFKVTAVHLGTANDAGSASGVQVVTVDQAPVCPAITVTGPSQPGTVGMAYAAEFIARGGTAPYSFAVTSGMLPSGLDLVVPLEDSVGLIGIPTQDAQFSFTITATDKKGCTGFKDFTIEITGPATTFEVASPSTATAGAAFNVTLTAKDASGKTARGYIGTVSLTSPDPKAVLPTNITFTAADSGVVTLTAILETAGTQSVTATDTVIATLKGTQSAIWVIPGAAATLTTTGSPTTTTAGTPFSVTWTVLDNFGNIAAGYGGTLHFTSSDPQAALPADSTLTNGTGTFSVTLKTAGLQSLAATDTLTPSITIRVTNIRVNAAPASTLVLTGFPSSITAGVPGAFTLTAFDPFKNVATGYLGTVNFTSSDPQAGLPGNYIFVSADNGSHQFIATLKTAGLQYLAVTDTMTPSITFRLNNIRANAAPASTLGLTGFPSPITAGVPGNLTLTAFDPFKHVATGYLGTVNFTSSDPKALLPANSMLINGVGTFSVTLKTAGTQSITATDSVIANVTGSQISQVDAAAAARVLALGYLALIPAGYRQDVTVEAVDSFGNTATGYAGTVSFNGTDPLETLPMNFTYGPNDFGIHTFSGGLTFRTVGLQTFNVTDLAAPGITTGPQIVQVNTGTPRIAISMSNETELAPGVACWTGTIKNTGTGLANKISVLRQTLRTLNGSGTVTSNSPAMPFLAGNLDPGGTIVTTFCFNLPVTVTRFSDAENGSLQDAAGTPLNWAAAQALIPW
jgi:hypothetical protein